MRDARPPAAPRARQGRADRGRAGSLSYRVCSSASGVPRRSIRNEASTGHRSPCPAPPARLGSCRRFQDAGFVQRERARGLLHDRVAKIEDRAPRVDAVHRAEPPAEARWPDGSAAADGEIDLGVGARRGVERSCRRQVSELPDAAEVAGQGPARGAPWSSARPASAQVTEALDGLVGGVDEFDHEQMPRQRGEAIDDRLERAQCRRARARQCDNASANTQSAGSRQSATLARTMSRRSIREPSEPLRDWR